MSLIARQLIAVQVRLVQHGQITGLDSKLTGDFDQSAVSYITLKTFTAKNVFKTRNKCNNVSNKKSTLPDMQHC